MAEVAQFTQPDSSPAAFIDFLDFLDRLPQVAQLRAAAVARMNLFSGARAIDVGCGIGGATFALSSITGPSGLAAGVDISTALIAVAAERASGQTGIEFRSSDACALPWPDAFFDAARSERVFLYLPDRLQAIREMMRVTKPGGRVVLVDTDVDCTAIHSSDLRLARKMTSIVAESLPNPGSARELPSLAKHSGLKNLATETFASPTPYEFFVRSFPDSLYKAAERGLVPRAEVDEWLADLARLNSCGDFFQMWPFTIVSGTV